MHHAPTTPSPKPEKGLGAHIPKEGLGSFKCRVRRCPSFTAQLVPKVGPKPDTPGTPKNTQRTRRLGLQSCVHSTSSLGKDVAVETFRPQGDKG